MKKIASILFLLLFMGVSAREGGLLFENLSSAEGLSSPVVHCIAQDTVGYLWFGTEDGLNRFDGYGFRCWRRTPDDAERSLSNSLIKCMLVDRTGTLWLGTGRGLNRYDPRTDSFRIPEAAGDTTCVLANSIIRSLREDGTGGLLVGTQSGLYRYDPAGEKLCAYRLPAGENGSGSIVVNICPGEDGRLWICTYDGLLSLDPASGKIRQYRVRMRCPHDPQNNLTLCVWQDSTEHGIAWVGTETGLHRLEVGTGNFTTYRMENGTALSNNVVKCILPMGSDTLLLGTDNGLNLFDKRSGRVVRYRHDASDALSIADNSVSQIFRDDHGICWFATRNGVSRISSYGESIGVVRLEPLADRRNATGESVRMAMTSAGECWLADGSEIMLCSARGDSMRRYASDFPVMTVQLFRIDSRGTVWVGSKNGLWYLDCRTKTFRPASAGMGGPDSRFINDIAEDADGDLWVTGTGCIYRLCIELDVSRNVAVIESERIPLPSCSDGVSALHADRSGAVWAAVGNDRIYRYDRVARRFDRYDAEHGRGLVSLHVKCFFEDRHGMLYVVTDSGIYRRNPRTGLFINLLPDDRIDCSRIRACGADAVGTLWMLLDTELVRFTPGGEMRLWNLAAFMPQARFLKDALFFRPDGTIRAGHSGGWLGIIPQRLPENRKTSRPRITGIDLLDADSRWKRLPFDQAKPLRLRHDRNNVRFSFSKLDNLFGNNLYSWRLDGVDEAWHTGYRNSASYINLPPGSYRFRVCDASVTQERGCDVSLPVVIMRPWWATPEAWTVWLSMLASAAFAVWWTVHSRIRLLLRKQAELRKRYLRYMAVGAAVPQPEPTAETLRQELAADASQPVQDPFLVRVITVIGSEIRNEDLDIRLLCDRLNTTHKSLYRKVKSLTGLHINELIRYVRLKEAARLLAETDKSVSEIAFEVGFSHRSYFSKCFVDHYALSPKEFREKCRR